MQGVYLLGQVHDSLPEPWDNLVTKGRSLVGSLKKRMRRMTLMLKVLLRPVQCIIGRGSNWAGDDWEKEVFAAYGNVSGNGERTIETDGSNHIVDVLLDETDNRPTGGPASAYAPPTPVVPPAGPATPPTLLAPPDRSELSTASPSSEQPSTTIDESARAVKSEKSAERRREDKCMLVTFASGTRCASEIGGKPARAAV